MSSLVAKLQSIETSEYLPSFSAVMTLVSTPSNTAQNESQTPHVEEITEPTSEELEMSFADNISAVSDSITDNGMNSSVSSFLYDYAPLTRRQEVALEREARLKAEEENLRFHPQLIARKSNNNYSDSEGRISRFEILYNEARQRQINEKSKVIADTSTFSPRITQRAKSRERSESPEDRINRLHSGYGSGRRNFDQDISITEQNTYRPRITKRAKSLERNNDSTPLNERLYQRAQAIEEKHRQLKVSSEKKLEEECTFSPKINSRRSPLREQEYRSPIEISDRMQRYLQERERRLQEAQRLKEEQDAINAPFRPQLSSKKKIASSRADVDLVDVFTRLACVDRDKEPTLSSKHVDPELTFQPQIHNRRRSTTLAQSSPSDSTSVSSSVHERLYEEGEQRRRELEINRQLQKQSDEGTYTFAPQLRTSTTPTRSMRSSPETVASDRETVRERLTSGRQYVQDILAQVKAQYELRDCTFTPEINLVSRQKAEANPRSSTPLHERLQAQAERTKEKLKKLEEDLKKKEMEKCTFNPIVIKSPVQVDTRGLGVFERMYQDEKDWEARVKKSRDGSNSDSVDLSDCSFAPKGPRSIKVDNDTDGFDRLSAKSPRRDSGLPQSNPQKRLSKNSLQEETMSAVSGLSERSGSVSSKNSFVGSGYGSSRAMTPSKTGTTTLQSRRGSSPAQYRASTTSVGSSAPIDEVNNGCAPASASKSRTNTSGTTRTSTPSKASATLTNVTRSSTPSKSSAAPAIGIRASTPSKSSTAPAIGTRASTPSKSSVTPAIGIRSSTPSKASATPVVGTRASTPSKTSAIPSTPSRSISGQGQWATSSSAQKSQKKSVQPVAPSVSSAAKPRVGSLSLLDAVQDASQEEQLSPNEPSISSVKSNLLTNGHLKSVSAPKDTDIAKDIQFDEEQGATAVEEETLLLNLDDIPHATPAVALRTEAVLEDNPKEPTIVPSTLSSLSNLLNRQLQLS